MVLWAIPQNTAMAMPAGANTTSVSLHFVVAPAAKKSEAVPLKAKKQVSKKQTANVLNKELLTKRKPVQKQKPPVKKPRPIVSPPVVKEEVANVVTENKSVTKKAEKKKKVITEKLSKSDEDSPTRPVSSGANQKLPVIEKATFVSKPIAPKYPRLARNKGVQGTATYEIWLNEHGEQIKQILTSSSGAKILDKAALKAIKKWQFSPQKINGQAIAHRVFVPVRFNLD
ncbi:energy transducer TonB [Aliivibrio kagoshimensis]|uniref:energy transducer TonB n=1 Tax=Aliivibrio kagoshimensis TaxID=2910230 RepID=UPI003D12FD62